MWKTKTLLPFKSESGDMFLIDSTRYVEETKDYHEAVARDDEETMIHYEAGYTGWRLHDG